MLNKKVSLVLGSGGARGYAHIGVIEILQEKGYEINAISGSSMGALIGGLYAAGKLDEFKQWILTLDYFDIFKLITFSSMSGGLVDAQKVFDKIATMIGDVNIEDLDIKYIAVATDINTQKEVLFTKGKLVDAIRASVSIPTIFSPIVQNDMILVDGGVLNPLPINTIGGDDENLIIAVNLDANIENKYTIKVPDEQKTREELLYSKVKTFFEEAKSHIPRQFFDILPSKKTKEENILEPNIPFVLSRTLDTAQTILSKYYIQNYNTDIMIDIPRGSCEFYEFTQGYKMIEIGKTIANSKL
jgi:NTE family protein